jgi:hypothetical protein
MKKKRPWLAIGIVIAGVVAIAALFAANKVHFVDRAPAVALGDQFFSALKDRAPDKAFALYSAEFRQMQGENWKQAILVKTGTMGSITGYSIAEQHIVPVNHVACILLRYAVQRTQVETREGIVMCPQEDSSWAIVGHELTRTDTGQHVSAGLTLHEVGIHVP